jgi:hypothetical protein
MTKDSHFLSCLTCLDLDGIVSTEIAEATIAQPPPKSTFSAVVCKRCLSLDRITRVTCHTFRRIAPNDARQKPDQPLDKN